MKLISGLFRACRRRLLTTDNDMGMFRNKLNELVAQKDSLSDEDVTARVEELKKITDDLPEDDGKAKLLRFLEDFKSVKEQDAKVAEEAAKAVADQFEKLDTAAMQDVPADTGDEEPETDETVEEVAEETVAPDTEKTEDGDEEKPAEEETAEEEVKEETTEDDDPNAEYSLEEIYQFIKKRMAEDAAAEEEPEEKTDEEAVDGLFKEAKVECDDECGSDDEKKNDVVTDHAPHIPVTVKDHAAGGNLRALFNMAKGE